MFLWLIKVRHRVETEVLQEKELQGRKESQLGAPRRRTILLIHKGFGRLQQVERKKKSKNKKPKESGKGSDETSSQHQPD
jgi:hypothetical protein